MVGSNVYYLCSRQSTERTSRPRRLQTTSHHPTPTPLGALTRLSQTRHRAGDPNLCTRLGKRQGARLAASGFPATFASCKQPAVWSFCFTTSRTLHLSLTFARRRDIRVSRPFRGSLSARDENRPHRTHHVIAADHTIHLACRTTAT